jgi:hypothetical protein
MNDPGAAAIRNKIYVLQGGESAPCDDISVVETLQTVDVGDPSWADRSVPCVEASAPKGSVRKWCEEHGVTLAPTEFFPGQIDHVLWFGTEEKREAFERKWLRGRGPEE